MSEHGSYIVYVDESGDHSLTSIDREYPVFVLSFCVFQKDVYVKTVTTRLRNLKFETFGHDMVILHEHEIRKKMGAFAKLSKEPRESFMLKLTDIVNDSDFTLLAVLIDKHKLKSRYVNPAHPYHLAMEFGLERLYRFMKEKRQEDNLTYLVCESRGAKEDRQLELEFRRICDGKNYFQRPLPFDIVIVDKKTNSEGLQLADLTARPIGLSVLRPDQKNRALQILEGKYYRDGFGRKEGFGLKCFP
ncbi:MAG: 3-deoxy-D-manno-octulosonic acid transferase [Deltaproteobacteria bacterium GWB2_55_19]|nr:MAG: 3-deoxy-D-manno-octulosonic acid transferase [Deltaproteobacteria bacterium GWB2_55_19]HAO92582.1 DUF3800 domain-containing protein [Deltaproteobacteria bacterium]